ncbi:hypothetical protein B7760_03367 [Burkholderia glumae]|nr:hypothetical protein B7760_03367 [Burkholderia glumae]
MPDGEARIARPPSAAHGGPLASCLFVTDAGPRARRGGARDLARTLGDPHEADGRPGRAATIDAGRRRCRDTCARNDAAGMPMARSGDGAARRPWPAQPGATGVAPAVRHGVTPASNDRAPNTPCAHRRLDTILSRYDFAFCGFPSRVGAASCVDAAHDPEPKALPVASFAVLRCRKWGAGGGRAAPVLAEQDQCRCRICASVCRNSSAHGSFFWQPLRHALMV